MWHTTELGIVCNIITGNSIPAKEKEKLFKNVDGMPYVATKDVSYDGDIDYKNGVSIPSKYLKKFKISPSKSVLVCGEGGSAGRKIAFSNYECCFGNKLFSINPKKNIYPEFLYHYTLSEQFQNQFKNALSGLIGGVSILKIKQFKISYPDLKQQKEIALKLNTCNSNIQSLIENTQQKISNTKNLMKKVTDNKIHINIKNYKEKNLDEITNKITCGVAKRPVYTEKGITFLSARNVKDGKMKWENFKYISENAHKSLTKNTKPEIGDILYSRVGAGFGDAAIIDKDIELSIFVSLTLIKVKPEILNEYMYYYLNSSIIKKLAKQNITGTGVGNLNVAAVKQFNIKLPNLAEQKKIIKDLKLLNHFVEKIISNYSQIIKNYKDLNKSIYKSLLYNKIIN